MRNINRKALASMGLGLALLASACGRGADARSEIGSRSPVTVDAPVSSPVTVESPVISSAPSSVSTTTADTSESAEPAPMYISTMVHMEGNWRDDELPALFMAHVEQIRLAMDIFDGYDAKLTVESEIPFSTAQLESGINVMQELLDDGHGVGTHCDVGFREDLMPVEDFAALLVERKSLMDELVGAENNRGCSGAGGANDWALAMDLAGFDYVDGLVGMHYLSMPEAERPAGWTDTYIRDTAFHDQAPVDLSQSIHPFEVADATDFVPDENGVIVVSAGSLGRLDTFAEAISGDDCVRSESCPLTVEDVDLEIEAIEEAIALHDPARVGKVDVYLPASIFTEANREVLEYFLARVDELVQQGLLQWATQGEVYDAYLAWNS